MKYIHYRHATGILYYGGLDILIDPMLASKERLPSTPNSWNELKNPRIDFPIDVHRLTIPSYCLVTHYHRDHFDKTASQILPKNIHLICQNEDQDTIRDLGFYNQMPIADSLFIGDVHIRRVEGQHGYGRTAEAMGVSSGYILKAPNEPLLYLTGDTVLCDPVEQTLIEYRPDCIIANAGGAQFSDDFLDPGPITLTQEHLMEIHHIVPKARIICVHMDAWNHCTYSKADLVQYISDREISRDTFIIPSDNETIQI